MKYVGASGQQRGEGEEKDTALTLHRKKNRIKRTETASNCCVVEWSIGAPKVHTYVNMHIGLGFRVYTFCVRSV